MFDSAIGMWRPGEVGTFGFPYHGRIDAGVDGVFVLSLPNGQTMRLVGAGGNSYGNCRVFRDPRAVDVVLTPPEAAAAAAAGAQWRPEAIVSEIGALGGVIGDQIIYHDGERNWRISAGPRPGNRTIARNLPIFRRGSEITQAYDAVVVHHYTGSDISVTSLTDLSVSVIDSLPDGSRHLIGMYGLRSATGRPGRAAVYNRELYALIELELAGRPGVDMTADYRLLYSPAAIAGEFSRVETNGISEKMLWSSLVLWTTLENGAPTTSYQRHELQPWTSGVVLQEGEWSVVDRADAVIGAYYSPDGEVREIRKRYRNTRTQTAVISPIEVTDTPATGIGRGPSFGVELTTPGSHTAAVTEVITITAELELSIVDDGEVRSSVTGQGLTVRTRTHTRYADIYAGPTGLAVASYSGDAGGEMSCTQSVAQDGHSLHEFESSESFSGLSVSPLPSPSFGAGSGGASIGYPGLISLLAPNADPRPQLDIGPVMYNPALIALGSRMWPQFDTSAVTLRIGDAASRGTVIPGWREGALPTAIYGSVNPITGQYARDTTRAVLWL